ncbi:MAG TPA: ComEC/Rec2 family competence protein [Rhizomicrobium sp.]|nr:ComEC/Rec2 family competence protein [Rhizomicrobium sp.]
MGVGPLTSIRRLVPRFESPETLPSPAAFTRAFVRWSWQCALADRDRWPLWLPVAFGIGVGIYFALPSEPISLFGAALGVSGVLLGLAATLTEAPAARAGQAIVAALLIGFAVAKHRTDSLAAPVLMHRIGPIAIDGRVESTQLHGKGVRVVLTVARAGHMRKDRMPRRVRVSIRSGGEQLKPGDWIDVRAVLLPPPAPAAPNDYDFGRAAFFRQIGAVGYAYGRPIAIAPQLPLTWTERESTAVELLRWHVSARIHAVLPGSTGAIAAALITGDRGGISEEDEGNLRDAGLAHVLAIAGLHMALVGLGLFWAVRAILALFPPIALTQPIKKWAAIAALGGAAFYLVISGAATPAMRAFIMLAVMLIAILADRPALSMRSVALAAFIVLALQPETLVEPGFQMSFAAVVSLIAVAEWERTRKRKETGPRRLVAVRHYIRGITTTSFVGSIATAPYAIFHFDRATHFAVLGNLGAMPIMGFVTMPAAALSVILMPFGLDEYPLRLMGWGIEAMLAVGRWVSNLPESVSLVSAWPISALAMMTFGGLWIALWRGPWRWLGIAPAMCAAALILASKPADIFVARDGMTIAVRGEDGLLHFVRTPDDKYSAGQWLKRDGDQRSPADAIAHPADGVRCDAYGCIARAANGMRVAAVLTPGALEEDCASNQIVISAVPVRGRCNGPRIVIDRFDVARNGAYAIWLDGVSTVQTAQQVRGERPWSAMPRSQYRRIRPTSLP